MSQNYLNLKKEYDTNEILLNEYQKSDLDTYPGWTFLLPNIIDVYGVCPYLDTSLNENRDRRMKWLKDTFDKGKVYYDTLTSINNKDIQNATMNELTQMVTVLEEKVHNIIDDFNNAFPEKKIEYNELIELIKSKVNCKSMNKKKKEEWLNTCNIMSDLGDFANFSFLKYTKVKYDLYVRHKTVVYENDSEISNILETCNKLQNRYLMEKDEYETRELNAKVRLVDLIKSKFQINQIGKYFKRWSSLSIEKKNERIKSYLDWYLREKQLEPEMLEIVYKFIQDNIACKNLKTTDISWNGKLGIITNINILIDINKEITIPKRTVSPRKVSQSNVGNFPEQLKPKIHRLILNEILKCTGLLNKSNIVTIVVSNIQITLYTTLKKETVVKYTSQKYDEILNLVLENKI